MKSHRNKLVVLLLVIAAIFLALRLPGIRTSYYQDEYKWPLLANPASVRGTVPHPPLSEFVYDMTWKAFGERNFRVTPFLFGFANLFLLYAVARRRFGEKEALAAAALFAVSFFSVLASLMVDTDGQILPFFLLLALYCYGRWNDAAHRRERIGWGAGLLAAFALGFLVKASFAIAVAAIALDFAWERRRTIFSRRMLPRYAVGAVGLTVVLALALVLARFVFPSFNLSYAIGYWKHFVVFAGRGWGQIFVQVAKGVLYLSPLLAAPLLLADGRVRRAARPLWLFLGIGLAFYLVLFDFSGGALDRYLQFLIVPTAMISGAALVSVFRAKEGKPVTAMSAVIAIAAALVVFALQFLPQAVPPLHPKSLWIGRAVSFKWNFLFPFMGGSGPLGFYVSFLFMAVAWVACLALVVVAYRSRAWRKPLVLALVAIGLVYNATFVEEYLVGGVNGRTRVLLRDSLSYIRGAPDVKKVTTYNDIGGFELMKMGKYRKRLYIDPKFDQSEKAALLNQFKEHYLVIDVPRIDPASMYARYFDSCRTAWRERSGYISATVYDCTKAPDVKP